MKVLALVMVHRLVHRFCNSPSFSRRHILMLTCPARGFTLPCGGVIIPTPFWTFGNDLLYRARIAFLWGATAISKNEV